ncbi:MAG: ATP-binding protein [Polyangiaceae bacterium]
MTTPHLSELEMARLALAKAPRSEDPGFARSLLQVLKVAAATLAVERVSIWRIADDWARIDCEGLYEEPQERFSSGQSLDLKVFPAYADALKERRVISAEDAHHDPRTRELEASYLSVYDVGALLDCPIYEMGQVVAILCHEQIGRQRAWSKRDADFAVNVADIVSTLFANAARARYEAELHQAREALAEARVMDSLGRMAARVAHDFNNTLMGVSLGIDAIEHERVGNAAVIAALSDCHALVDQGARLVRQLLAFARSDGNDGKTVDLCGTVAEMAPRLRRLLGPDVTLTTEAPNECALVALDLASLEQVLMNLALNARDALPGGGAIHISAQSTETLVTLRVRDTGVGMDADTRQRIFEPFFSTKGERGSGLGLAIVFGAVRHARGNIEVESQIGAGTTFSLRFPRQKP